MTDIIVNVKLTQETCFDSYTKFQFREKDISLEIGSIIEIANIDCKILSVNEDGTFQLMVQTGLIEKFANCLFYSHDEHYEKVEELISNLSCED